MVKALHRADIEVISDGLYNHTVEGDQRGPTLYFRELGNSVCHILEEDRARYANYSDTSNAVNADHPIVRRMIVDSLRYWVEEMHVDGSDSIWRRSSRAIRPANRCQIRRFCGTSSRTPRHQWERRLSPRLGMRPACITWAASSEIVGRSGRRFRDDVRAFVVVNPIPWVGLPTGSSVALRFIATVGASVMLFVLIGVSQANAES